MFGHLKFGVSDYAASKALFLKALEPLGAALALEGAPACGVELSPKSKASLCRFQTEEKPAHLHLAFQAERRQQAEAFLRAALEAVPRTMARPAYAPLSRAPLCSVRSRSGPVQHRGGLPRTCGSDVVHPATPAGQGDI